MCIRDRLSIVGMAMPSMRLCFLLPVASYLVLCIFYLERAIWHDRKGMMITNIVGISVSALAILINVIIIFWSAIYGFFAGLGGVLTALIFGGLILIASIVFKVLQVNFDWNDLGLVIYTIVQIAMIIASIVVMFFSGWGWYLMSVLLLASALVIGSWDVEYGGFPWYVTVFNMIVAFVCVFFLLPFRF